MKKILFLFIALSLASPRLLAQNDADSALVNHLYYGNPGKDLGEMCFLAQGWAVGVGAKNDWLYLLTPKGLVADSLNPQPALGSNGFGNFVDRVLSVAPSQAMVVCASGNLLVEREGSRLKLRQQWREYTLTNSDWRGATFRVGNWVAGYERGKQEKKRGVARQDDKNFPEFWVKPITDASRKLGQAIPINPELPKLTDDLYYDWKDFDLVTLRTEVHRRAVSLANGKLYFNVTRANRCYVFDTLTQKVSYFDYPPVTKQQSHFCYFDVEGQQLYVVKKESRKQYLIYRYQPADGQLVRVGQAKMAPQGFAGGRVHVAQRVKLPGERAFVGHYLLPLGQAPVSADFKLLKMVEVNN
jgi:hypothetical protein